MDLRLHFRTLPETLLLLQMVVCEQTFCVNGVAKIVGVGLTKTVVVISGPAHPFKVE